MPQTWASYLSLHLSYQSQTRPTEYSTTTSSLYRDGRLGSLFNILVSEYPIYSFNIPKSVPPWIYCYHNKSCCFTQIVICVLVPKKVNYRKRKALFIVWLPFLLRPVTDALADQSELVGSMILTPTLTQQWRGCDCRSSIQWKTLWGGFQDCNQTPWCCPFTSATPDGLSWRLEVPFYLITVI